MTSEKKFSLCGKIFLLDQEGGHAAPEICIGSDLVDSLDAEIIERMERFGVQPEPYPPDDKPYGVVFGGRWRITIEAVEVEDG